MSQENITKKSTEVEAEVLQEAAEEACTVKGVPVDEEEYKEVKSEVNKEKAVNLEKKAERKAAAVMMNLKRVLICLG